MADLLKFKHGLQANLKQNSPAVVAGTVYITRDERAMYVDLPAYKHEDGTLEQAKRIRIGDLRNYEYLSDSLVCIFSSNHSHLFSLYTFFV